MNALTLAKEIADEITGWRRDLHRIPEIGLNLPKTRLYPRPGIYLHRAYECGAKHYKNRSKQKKDYFHSP